MTAPDLCEYMEYNQTQMAYFNFIDDEDLIEAVRCVLSVAERATSKAETELEKNVLDPFAALFSVAYNHISLEDWNRLEKERQAQKSIQNAIGEFHQKLLGSFYGWKDAGRGGSVDLVNEDKKIIAEVKNKYNTMNSSAATETYSKLANHLKYDRKGYTAYLVQIIPQHAKDYDVSWSPNQTTLTLRQDIRRIDGESFYDLASGEKDTLYRIYESLPGIISSLLGGQSVDPMTVEALKPLFVRVY